VLVDRYAGRADDDDVMRIGRDIVSELKDGVEGIVEGIDENDRQHFMRLRVGRPRKSRPRMQRQAAWKISVPVRRFLIEDWDRRHPEAEEIMDILEKRRFYLPDTPPPPEYARYGKAWTIWAGLRAWGNYLSRLEAGGIITRKQFHDLLQRMIGRLTDKQIADGRGVERAAVTRSIRRGIDNIERFQRDRPAKAKK